MSEIIELKSENLIAKINSHGAELISVVDRKSGYEFIWQADSDYWGRHAPVLFPIVGELKNGKMTYDNKEYYISRHGFARDLDFVVQSQSDNSVSLNLKSSKQTQEVYPFEFSLQITYILFGSKITVTYEVLNESKSNDLYYSIGGHPAFNVSQRKLANGQVEFDQISFSLEPSGKYYQIPLTKEGYADTNRGSWQSTDCIELSHDSFKDDALIFQLSKQTEAVLTDGALGVEIRLKPSRMDYLGLWSTYPKRAGFICVEPWAGLADTVDFTGEFSQKLGIIKTPPLQITTHDYTITFKKD